MRWVALLGALAGAASCTSRPHAELVVVVVSDMAVPAALDRVEVDVEVMGDARGPFARPLGSMSDLPATLTLTSDGGTTGPVRVTARGFLGDAVVVEERAITTFVEGPARALTIWLLDRCRAEVRDCPADTSCQPGGCVPEARDGGSLPLAADVLGGGFDAGVEALDAAVTDGGVDAGDDGGSPDAGTCAPTGPETCDGTDDDCDGRVDEAAENDDVTSSLLVSGPHPHCGRCGQSCDPCVGGDCDGVRSVEALVAESCYVRSSAVATGGLDCGPGTSMDALTTSMLRLEAGPAADPATPPLVCLLSPADDGTVYCVGADFDNEGVPGCTCGDARCLECPDLVVEQTAASRLTGVRDLAVGGRHACAIAGGVAYCMGANDQGQKGSRRTSEIDIQAVAVDVAGAEALGQVVAGANFTCVREADGTRGRAYCFGSGDQYCLGRDSTVMNAFIPLPVVRGDAVTPIEGIVDIACAGDGIGPTNPFAPHCCAVRDDGEVWCWGAGGLGQLDGVATTLTRNLPRRLERPSAMGLVRDVEVGPTLSCAVTVDDEVWCWGASGAVRQMPDLTNHAPVRISFPEPVAVRDLSLSAGLATGSADAEVFALARAWDGTVWCWGSNYDHQCNGASTMNVRMPLRVTP